MLQLGPALSGLECFLKLVKIISALGNISITDPSSITAIITAAADFLASCVPIPLKFACTILDVVRLLIMYLICLLQAVLSVLQFQVTINLSAAAGNSVLLTSLKCAQANSDAAMNQLAEAITIIETLLSLVQPVLSIAESVLPQPVKDGLSLISEVQTALVAAIGDGSASAGVPGVQGIVQTLQGLLQKLTELQAVLAELPC